jgi:hypothetical protein
MNNNHSNYLSSHGETTLCTLKVTTSIPRYYQQNCHNSSIGYAFGVRRDIWTVIYRYIYVWVVLLEAHVNGLIVYSYGTVYNVSSFAWYYLSVLVISSIPSEEIVGMSFSLEESDDTSGNWAWVPCWHFVVPFGLKEMSVELWRVRRLTPISIRKWVVWADVL